MSSNVADIYIDKFEEHTLRELEVFEIGVLEGQIQGAKYKNHEKEIPDFQEVCR